MVSRALRMKAWGTGEDVKSLHDRAPSRFIFRVWGPGTVLFVGVQPEEELKQNTFFQT